MFNTSKLISETKLRRRLADWLASRGRSAGDRLFQENDAMARRHGWQAETRRGGLGRVYRDQRFDLAHSPVSEMRRGQ
jgi:hypothetical protein